MHQCLLVHGDGTAETVIICQTHAHTLFASAPLTMLGAVPSLDVFAVGMRDAEHLPPNPLCTDASYFIDLPVRGPVLFVGTDARGEQMSVDCKSLLAQLTKEYQNGT